MKSLISGIAFFIFFLFLQVAARGQVCTTPGQTPSTAFPVCGITTFQQNDVPICSTNSLFVPGCTANSNANYANKNPFFYKFTCYASGTLGFLITPNAANEDYDWQLYDITGVNPNDIFTNNALVVSGNWSGSYGTTGASATGANFIQCASDPATQNTPRFAAMPILVAGHEYLLMISHFTDTQSGYSLSFGGGSVVITDPALPHLQKATPDCNGKTLLLKLNKNLRCNSFTSTGSEFSLLPAATTVVSAMVTNCSAGFDFDEITITLATALPANNYQLIINNGSDGNTLLDFCDRSIPAGEQTPFRYDAPQPTPIDSIGSIGCAPDTVKIYFSKKIDCSSIAADGSDFSISGPTPVTVIAATGNCINGASELINVKFAAPIYTKGNYLLTLKTGTDGSTVNDVCGQQTLPQSIPFRTADTVSAQFTYNSTLGCRLNTLTFLHDGAHDVNKWNWTFNNNNTSTIQNPTFAFPASGTNTIKLTVSNGVCSAASTGIVIFNNEVKAGFEMPDIICPEDPLVLTNTSTGLIDAWRWKFDVFGVSTMQNPAPVNFPINNIASFYAITLAVTNNVLNCKDSITKKIRVLNNCFIAVPSAFTPNADGRNDFLYPTNALKADNLEFKVFNRWGQLVFISHNWQEKWNGKINGIEQAPGVYVWFLSYTHSDTGKKIFQKGTTVLIR